MARENELVGVIAGRSGADGRILLEGFSTALGGAVVGLVGLVNLLIQSSWPGPLPPIIGPEEACKLEWSLSSLLESLLDEESSSLIVEE